ncbi:hypothetical protein [Salinigranum rubrum]|nr:hypothetical protein [Salinigranum rubrum]
MEFHLNRGDDGVPAAEKRADFEAIDNGSYEFSEADFDKLHVLEHLLYEHDMKNDELAELFGVTLQDINSVLHWHGLLYPELPPGKFSGEAKWW